MTRRLAALLVPVTAALTMAEIAVMHQAHVPLLSEAAFRNGFPLINVGTVVGVLVGAVIVSRHPRHRIGWLFCWGQLGVALGLLLRAVADRDVIGPSMSGQQVGELADLLANLLGSQLALVLLAALLLLAPDGRLRSRRWRPFLVTLPVAYALVAAGLVSAFLNGPTPANEVVLAAGQLGVLIALIASVIALLVRLRASTGDTRQQLRWIAATAGVLASAPVLAVASNLTYSPITPIWVILLLHLGYLGVPLATGVAVLRYRLYDIDRLVGGSVVLAVLAALALGGYVAVVGLAGLALPGSTSDSWLSLLVFVLVVLVLQPVRRYVRRLADRLVYGPQSMSYEALARLTSELSASPRGARFLAEVAESAGRLVHAQLCTAVLIGADGVEQTATWSGGGADMPATLSSPWLTLVKHHGVAVGRLQLLLPDLAVGGAQRRELLARLADNLAPV